MMRLLALLLGIFLCLSPIGCATPGTDTSGEDSVLNLDEDTGPADQAAKTDEITDEITDSGEAPAEKAQDQQNLAQEDDLEKELNQDQPQDQEPAKVAEEPAPQPEPEAEPQPAPMAEEPPPAETQALAPQEPAAPPPDAAQSGAAEITNIKYLANQSGGSVVIETSQPVTYQTRMKPETKQFVVEITGATLPAKLKRPYLMKEFGAAFAAINAYQNAGASMARVVIQMKDGGTGEPTVQQEGNSIVVVPGAGQAPPPETTTAQGGDQPAPTESAIDEVAAQKDEQALGARSLDEFLTGSNKFYGRPISIEVSDADVREVLNFIAVESGLNLILSEDVGGKITVKLRGIPWDQALVTIIRARKLGYVRQGNVVRISSLDTLQQENDVAKKIIDSQKTLSPLRVKVIPVSYALVEELASKVKPFLTAGRGETVVDSRTSSMIITDTEVNLEKITRLVKELDRPPAQVMIEGKVVEAQESFSQTLGLNWSLGGVAVDLASSGGYKNGPVTLLPSVVMTNGKGGGNLTTALTVGTLEGLGNITALLSMAEEDSLVKILSSPRVVTTNKEKATISQMGEVITVQTTRDVQGNVTRNPTRSSFSLELNVTPQVTNEGSVIMDVDVKRQFPGAIADSDSGARPINSRSAKTKIMVRDGQTSVIGGIYSADTTNQETGIPGLREIPVLGWLFKSRTRTDAKNELLIFLTPKILNIKDQGEG